MRGEVHDCVDLMLREEPRYQRMIADITDDQLPREDGLPETFGQVIENDDSLAGLAELPHHMTANVSGAAGD